MSLAVLAGLPIPFAPASYSYSYSYSYSFPYLLPLLSQLGLKSCLAVLLVDLTDAGGSLMGGSLRELVGRNPVVLVGTKLDLLPEVRVMELEGFWYLLGDSRLLSDVCYASSWVWSL
jgi:hypothetical protein